MDRKKLLASIGIMSVATSALFVGHASNINELNTQNVTTVSAATADEAIEVANELAHNEEEVDYTSSQFTTNFIDGSYFVLENEETGNYVSAKGHYIIENESGKVVDCIEPEKTIGTIFVV